MSISPSDTSNKLQLHHTPAVGHKRALSSNQPHPYQSSLGDDLKCSRNNSIQSSRSPINKKTLLSSSTSNQPSSTLNYTTTTTGNSGLAINSAYGLNFKRLSNSSSSGLLDFENNSNNNTMNFNNISLSSSNTNPTNGNNSNEVFLSEIAQNRPHDRRLSNEELIDVMEKEQDAIVIKLMKEISSLKEENMILKQQVMNSNNNNTQSRSQSRSSISSNSMRFNSNYITTDDNNTNSSLRYKRPLFPTPRRNSTKSRSRSTTPTSPSIVNTNVFSPRTVKCVPKD